MRPADRAWLAIAFGVTAYEIVACRRPGWELLSQAADRHRASHPVIVHAAAVYLACHLTRKWPQKVDPLHRLASRLSQ